MKYGDIKQSHINRESEYQVIIIKVVILTSMLFFNTQVLKAEINNPQKAEEDLSRINKTLEKLETKLRNNDYIKACLEASRAAKIIRSELKGLKEIEPNYNWLEIREVLIEIPIRYCPKAIHKEKEY